MCLWGLWHSGFQLLVRRENHSFRFTLSPQIVWTNATCVEWVCQANTSLVSLPVYRSYLRKAQLPFKVDSAYFTQNSAYFQMASVKTLECVWLNSRRSSFPSQYITSIPRAESWASPFHLWEWLGLENEHMGRIGKWWVIWFGHAFWSEGVVEFAAVKVDWEQIADLQQATNVRLRNSILFAKAWRLIESLWAVQRHDLNRNWKKIIF